MKWWCGSSPSVIHSSLPSNRNTVTSSSPPCTWAPTTCGLSFGVAVNASLAVSVCVPSVVDQPASSLPSDTISRNSDLGYAELPVVAPLTAERNRMPSQFSVATNHGSAAKVASSGCLISSASSPPVGRVTFQLCRSSTSAGYWHSPELPDVGRDGADDEASSLVVVDVASAPAASRATAASWNN